MPKLTDLKGREIGGWRIGEPAPSVKRVRHWVAAHSCGLQVSVLPHELLMRASEGRLSMPPCDTCEPAPGAEITMGLHRGPEDPAHLVGTDCAPGSPTRPPGAGSHATVQAGQCKHGLILRSCLACKPLAGPALDLKGAVVKGSDTAAPVVGQYELGMNATGYRVAVMSHPGWEIADSPDPGELIQAPPFFGKLYDAGTGAVVVHGKAEALAEGQIHLEVIGRGITQKAKPANGHAGMSGLGGCERKLAYRLAYGKPATAALRPWMGTQAHNGFETVYQADNARQVSEQEYPAPTRWVMGTFVEAGGERGVIDLYDRLLFEVIDFKAPGITAVKRVGKGVVGDNYQVQLDLYALGMTELGYRVDRVSLLAVPVAGELEDATYYSRPADLDNARAALARRDKINTMLGMVDDPAVVLGVMSIQEDSCMYCPVRKVGMCPGVDVKETPPAIGWDPTPTPPPPGVVATTLEEK